MKILYVILTCEKYLNTRVKWQKETWLKNVADKSINGATILNVNFLVDPIGEETYNNAPKKYIDFFDKNPNICNYYDWFFFCDDDTFVFIDKLEKLLRYHYDMPPQMIGFVGGTFDIHSLKIIWCSGGAGIALNRSAVKAIQTHLRNTPRPLVTHETDISLAIWATMATENLTVIDNKRFSPFNPFDAKQQGLEDCITYHYMTENDFIKLGREL